jgi:putative membrane protein
MAVLIVLRLFSVLWFLLRFFGYRLTLHGEDLRIACGLFTRVSATVPRKRIQFISIHRPLFLRWMGLASLRIETAGGGGRSENGTTTVSRRWFVPVMPETEIPHLAGFLRPGLQWQEAGIDWRPLATTAGKRLMRIAVLQSLLVAGLGMVATRPWGWLAGLAALPLLLGWARKKARSMRYSRTARFVVYRSGVLNRKTSLTFFDKVQTVTVRQTPFDRRWKMATLAVDTAASGPAEHNIQVRYLEDEFARREFDSIAQTASRYPPDFG